MLMCDAVWVCGFGVKSRAVELIFFVFMLSL